MSKITLTTVKKFIRDNTDLLFANCTSSFDGMTDCVEQRKDGFSKVDASKIDMSKEQNLGIEKLWFVRGSRDYFTAYDDGKYTGFEITNSCGCSIIAVNK